MSLQPDDPFPPVDQTLATQADPPVEQRYHVLLVDDNEVNQQLWSELLAHEGFVVAAARSGEEALAVLEERPIDLILLDVVMPGMSGFEVLQAVRKRFNEHQLPVIMATSKDQSEDVVRAFKLGANDYVTKPLDLAVTIARIHAQLRAKSRMKGEAGRDQVQPGTVLEGKYRIDSLIGRGNFGAVFRATHLKLQRPVAVKILRSAVGTDQVSLARFQQEGIALSRLEHPNAVQVLDFSADANGLVYLVMELLEGQTLDEEIRAEGRLAPARCIEILLQVCDVLAEAHRLGIIHRDVKPQNIFLHRGRQGEVVKVLDFGIAKWIGDTEIGQQLTVEGNSVGTPAYMAPERFLNELYDGRADVYSLAATAFEMLTGVSPFRQADGNFFKLIRMHVTQPPPSLRSLVPSVPPALEQVVLLGLAKKSQHRPHATDFAERLRSARAELPSLEWRPE
jgi:DNA-binding response OmpR family regulator